MEPARKLHPGITALIVIVLVGIAATAIIVIHNNSNKAADTSSTTTTQMTASSAADTVTTTTYKDGTYNAVGSYVSPAGKQSIELTVTLKDGIITDTSLAADATDSEAKDYQMQFAGGYKTLIVGKNIDRVALSRVAGSSLTSNGFNDALDQIKTDAKA